MAEKDSLAVETHTHYIEAGLIDLPINYALHLPKRNLPILVLPRLVRKTTIPFIRAMPKTPCPPHPRAPGTRHLAIPHVAGIAVLVRVFLGKATTKHGSKNR